MKTPKRGYATMSAVLLNRLVEKNMAITFDDDDDSHITEGTSKNLIKEIQFRKPILSNNSWRLDVI